MDTLYIPPPRVDSVWGLVGQFLQPAVDQQDGYLMEDVKIMLLRGAWQLWVAVDDDNEVHASGVTRIDNYPRKRVLTITFLGGKEMKNWKHLLSDIEATAVQNGCNELEIQGRKGWAREMKDFKHTDVVCYKKIGDSHG